MLCLMQDLTKKPDWDKVLLNNNEDILAHWLTGSLAR